MNGAAAVSKTVLHVAQSVETGVAHVLEDHVRHQHEAGWHVVVACPGGSLATVAAGAGAEVVDWHAARQPGLSVAAEARALRCIVAHVRPDVVHLHSAKAGLVGRLVLRGRVPTVFTPHAWSWLAAQGVVRLGARAWERWGSRWAQAIVCLSPGEVAQAHEVGISRGIELIPNDVPITRLRRLAPASREAARAAVGEPVDAPLVVCAARIVPQKGQDVLVTAWRTVAERCPGARLALVGDGPDYDALVSDARDVSGVRFAGMQDRIGTLAWMRAADVVVCPSRYEGMSLVPMEAAALGIPVVASAVEGMESTLPPTARRLVPPEQATELAAALVAVLEDPQGRELGARQALTWADDVAASSGACARTLQLYERLLRPVAGDDPTAAMRSGQR